MSVAGVPSFPAERAGEALSELARRLQGVPRGALPRFTGGLDDAGLEAWLGRAAEALELELEPAQVQSSQRKRMLSGCAPALFITYSDGLPELVVVLRASRRSAVVLGEDLGPRRVGLEVLAKALEGNDAKTGLSYLAAIESLGLPLERQDRAEQVLRSTIGERMVSGWLVRARAASTPQLLRESGAVRPARAFVLCTVGEYAAYLASWWLLGGAVLRGHIDEGRLFAWLLTLLTLIGLRAGAQRAAGHLAAFGGAAIKLRLFQSALGLPTDTLRTEGVGRLAGRVMEAEELESFLTSGVLELGTGALELGVALLLLLFGGAAGALGVGLMVWIGASALLMRALVGRARTWTKTRLSLTHRLIEDLVAYRTRLVQGRRERWHEKEDVDLAGYLSVSGALDRLVGIGLTVIPRGWLLLGLCGIALQFAYGHPSSTGLALSLGGILLAWQALSRLCEAVPGALGAANAWEQVRPLISAAKPPPPAPMTERGHAHGAILDAEGLTFAWPTQRRAVLQGCSLKIRAGDRILVEGPSGSGKSTLANVLSGLETPSGGVLLLRGLDGHTVGFETWRKHVVTSPQFHQNHVFNETFAFNLLMGAGWPPTSTEVEDGVKLCRELGLGPLLDRMPVGLEQVVGNSGWRLSHGERSRLFIARGLLQKPDVLILDESFAALDPESLRACLKVVTARARAVMVIAHP